MLLRIMRFLGGSMACVALASSASAETPVSTLAKSANIGGEFRAEWMQTNNGLMKTDDFTPSSDSMIQTQIANLTLGGMINKDTEYKFRFSVLGGGANFFGDTIDPLIEGWGKHSMGPMFWKIGRQQVHQGGHDNMSSWQGQHARGAYGNAWAFKPFEDALTLGMEMRGVGEIAIQLLNDKVSVSDTDGRWNKNAHPTFVIAWHGNYGGIQPLIHFGTYDNQKSTWIDIGVKAEMKGVSAYLDYSMTTNNSKVSQGADKDPIESKDVATAITLYAGYTIKKTATPWIYFSNYNVAQDENSKIGTKDAEGNTTIAAAKNSTYSYFDDNGTTIALGADLNMFGDGWAPYLAIANQTGKFLDGTKTETKSELMIKLGAHGTL